MTITERDMTRLSLFMASLVSSPDQASRFIALMRKNADDAAFASIIDALRTQIEASAAGAQPSLSTLRQTVESLIAKKSEPATTAGRLLAAALENHR